MNRMSRLLPLLVMLVVAVPVRAETLPVTMQGFVGTPADSSSRRRFMAGFDQEFAEGKLRCERQTGDHWLAGEAKPNPFVLVDAVSADQAWLLDISIGVPSEVRVTRPKKHRDDKEAPRARMSELRTSRGLTIFTAATPPTAGFAGARPIPLRFAVYFGTARRVVVPNAKLPGGAYDYPWEDAGRVVARAALEALMRSNGDLAVTERADLAPATRTEPLP